MSKRRGQRVDIYTQADRDREWRSTPLGVASSIVGGALDVVNGVIGGANRTIIGFDGEDVRRAVTGKSRKKK